MNKKDQAIVDKAISMDWDDLAHSIIKLEIESDKIPWIYNFHRIAESPNANGRSVSDKKIWEIF